MLSLFSIVKMPYLSSNIPSSIFLSTMSSELLCIASFSIGASGYIPRAGNLLNHMKKQGARTYQRLIKNLERLFS